MNAQTRHQDMIALWIMALCFGPTGITIVLALFPGPSPLQQIIAPVLATLSLGICLIAAALAGHALASTTTHPKQQAAKRLAICLATTAVLSALATASAVATSIAAA